MTWWHRVRGWPREHPMPADALLALLVMGPAFGRPPIAPPTLLGGSIQLILGLALFIPLFLWDRRTVGHTPPATRLGFAMAALTVAIPLFVFWFGLPWAKIAAHLPGVGA